MNVRGWLGAVVEWKWCKDLDVEVGVVRRVIYSYFYSFPFLLLFAFRETSNDEEIMNSDGCW